MFISLGANGEACKLYLNHCSTRRALSLIITGPGGRKPYRTVHRSREETWGASVSNDKRPLCSGAGKTSSSRRKRGGWRVLLFTKPLLISRRQRRTNQTPPAATTAPQNAMAQAPIYSPLKCVSHKKKGNVDTRMGTYCIHLRRCVFSAGPRHAREILAAETFGPGKLKNVRINMQCTQQTLRSD